VVVFIQFVELKFSPLFFEQTGSATFGKTKSRAVTLLESQNLKNKGA